MREIQHYCTVAPDRAGWGDVNFPEREGGAAKGVAEADFGAGPRSESGSGKGIGQYGPQEAFAALHGLAESQDHSWMEGLGHEID